MKSIISSLLAAILFLFPSEDTIAGKPIHVLVVAGGHSFDTTAFYNMFQSFENITFDTLMQPHANRVIASGKVKEYDVLVFYDMWKNLNSLEKAAYIDWFQSGKGMVFLHHSIVSYQDWNEFKEIVGGKYYTRVPPGEEDKLSNYRHDIEIPVSISDPSHPVTKGMDDFQILDEGYENIWLRDGVKILLEADHPDCYPVTGWTHSYLNGEVVYLMHGHDRHAYQNENFQLLVQNAIWYVAQ